ncbi:hypothetical protein [Micromonospora sp. NPDC000442]|uniref:hypothetical protein n=1 Tax=Micromonospora sp. NPDC000442 TaxID=3364217 RepID=UPI0036C94CC4
MTYSLHTSITPVSVQALANLYGIVYAEPPYEEGPEEVAGFRNGLPEEARRPGVTLDGDVAEDSVPERDPSRLMAARFTRI